MPPRETTGNAGGFQRLLAVARDFLKDERIIRSQDVRSLFGAWGSRLEVAGGSVTITQNSMEWYAETNGVDLDDLEQMIAFLRGQGDEAKPDG